MGIFTDMVTNCHIQFEPTLRELALLERLAANKKPSTIRGLASDLAIPKPSVTRNVQALLKHGFVSKAENPDDRRSIFVQLTDHGQGFVKWMKKPGAEIYGADHTRKAA